MSQEDLKKKFPKVYEFFGGDEYRASVLINKYLLRDREGNFLEHSVEEVIERVARNIAQHTEDPAAYFVRFRDAIDGFRGVCPQGSILAAAGNDIFLQSLSNCFVTSSPEDTMSSIFGKAAIEQVSVLKFRGGDGMCLDNLRPEGTSVSNAARTSSGVPGFSHQISNNCNTVAQCLDGESLVLTKAGLKKIKDIEIDEKVWTHNKWATVLNKVKNTKNVIKLHTEYGRELICSEDHVIGTPEGEIKAGSLKEGDSINAIVGQGWIGKPIELNYHYERQGNNQSNRLREIKVPRTLSPSFAYLIGNIYGDGCLEYVKGKKSMLSVALSPNHPEIKEKLVRIAETELGVYAKIGKGDGCEVLGLGSRALIALLEQNNLLKQKAHELVFPESLLTAQTEVVMAFISGFFDADGSAALKKKSYKLCSVCKPFLSKIQMVLQAHGIISKIHSTDRSNFGWRTLYSLTINGKRSQNLFKRYCHESIKISASHWHNKVRDFTRTPYRVKDFNTKSSRHSYIIDNKQYITYSTLERLCFDLSLSSDNYLLVQDRIKSISEYPQGDVYDLCLDHSHLFFCQGIQVHNSGRRGAQMITLSVKHPDAEGFAKMKLDPTRVTGANVSLKLTDEFMKAVEEDGVFVQQWPVDSENPEIVKKIKARDLWKIIVNSAWTRAEPGLLNWDHITRTLPAHFFPGFKTRSTNPCCFSMNSSVYVPTKQGIKEIKEITNKDLVWIDSEKRWEKTSGYFKAGSAEVFEVKFDNNETLYLTHNHKLMLAKRKRIGTCTKYVEGGPVFVRDLKVGTKILSHQNSTGESGFGKLGTYEEGLILGWLSGDGTLSFSDSAATHPETILQFWEKEHDIVPLMQNAFSVLDENIEKPSIYTNNKNKVLRLSSLKFTKNFTSKYESNIWKFRNGFNPFLFSATKQFLKGYLTSYFTADGTVSSVCSLQNSSSAYIHLASIDKDRLIQIKNILCLFGIKSHVGLMRPSGTSTFHGRTYKTQDCYRLVINGKTNIRKFAQEVGFLSKAKKDILDEIVRWTNNGHPEKGRNYITVKEVKSVGIQEVGCIEVFNKHSFTANGLISFNSEIPLSEYDACRLTTICLTKYVKNKFEESAYFDFDGFKTDVRTGMRFMDAVVDAEIAQIQKIIDKVKKDQVSGKFKDPAIFNIELEMWEKIKLAATNGRRCGLGTHGLGDCLAQLRIRYDSDEAIKMVDSIYRTLSHTAYDESIEMAIEKGPFPVWDWETEKECEFFKHFPEELLEKMKRHGRRNISILTIAPTGSIATLSGSSSGIEPSFRLCYLRRKKVNPNDISTRVDFVDLVGEKWQNYLMTDYNVKTYLDKFNIRVPSSVKNDAELLDYIPDYFITADKIDWRKRVKIQGTAQKYLDHSISSTLNLPENVSEEVVGGIYMQAWKEGLKGVTVYREGCRSGVLISNDTKKEEEGRPTSIARQEAPKRSDRLPCDVHITKVKGEEWVVIIGLMNGTVYEVFCGEHKNHIPAKSFSGHVVKKGKKNYILEYIDDSGKVKELDINKYFKNEEYQGITRLLSMSIRHGTPLEYVIQQLQRSSLAVNGLEAALSRILKKYIKIEDLQKIHNKCGTCGSSDVTSKHESGCLSIICNSCNAVDSKCN